jgi:hypothetical protein
VADGTHEYPVKSSMAFGTQRDSIAFAIITQVTLRFEMMEL